jgi:hypothetical protein
MKTIQKPTYFPTNIAVLLNDGGYKAAAGDIQCDSLHSYASFVLSTPLDGVNYPMINWLVIDHPSIGSTAMSRYFYVLLPKLSDSDLSYGLVDIGVQGSPKQVYIWVYGGDQNYASMVTVNPNAFATTPANLVGSSLLDPAVNSQNQLYIRFSGNPCILGACIYSSAVGVRGPRDECGPELFTGRMNSDIMQVDTLPAGSHQTFLGSNPTFNMNFYGGNGPGRV